MRLILALAVGIVVTSSLVQAEELTVVDGTLRLPSEGLTTVSELRGRWEVYVGRAVHPEELRVLPQRTYLHVPPPYGRYYTRGGERLVSGVITYRLEIENVPASDIPAIRIPLAHGGLRAWVNGRELVDVGTGDVRLSHTPFFLPQAGGRARTRVERGVLIPLVPNHAGRAELVIHITSVNYPYSGMTLFPARVGPLQMLIRDKNGRVFWDGLFAGAILLLAMYHLLLRLGPNQKTPTLTLGLLLVFLAFRLLAVEGEMVVTALPWVSARLHLRLQGLAIYPLVALYVHFIRSMFPVEAYRTPMTILRGASWTWLGLSLVVPASLWMDLLYAWTPVAAVAVGLIGWTSVRAVVVRRSGARIVAAAVAVVIVGATLESLRAVDLLPFQASPVPVTVLIFAGLNSLALSRRIFDFRISLASLRDQAQHDGLTGLHNRRSFDSGLNEEWARHVRSVSPLALIMVDIDNFKRYNDTKGHQAGDVVLQAVARVLDSHAQRTNDLAARYGGEEFVVLLPNTEARGAYLLAEKIRRAVEELAIDHPGTDGGVVTVSLGVSALMPRQDDRDINGAQCLLKSADTALYDAKGAGRNAVRTASPEGLGCGGNGGQRVPGG